MSLRAVMGICPKELVEGKSHFGSDATTCWVLLAWNLCCKCVSLKNKAKEKLC